MRRWKWVLVILCFHISVFLIGCTNEVPPITRSFTIEPFTVEQIDAIYSRIWDEAIYNNFLYYICYEDPDDEQALLVRVDLDNHYNPDIFRIDIPPEQLIQRIAVGDDGSVHILATHNIEKNKWAKTINLYWHQLDDKGNIIHTVLAPDEFLDRPHNILIDFKVRVCGNAYIGIYADFEDPNDLIYDIFVINPASQVLLRESLRYFNYLFKDVSGNVYISRYTALENVEGFTTAVISRIDIAAGRLDDTDITAYNHWRQSAAGLYIDADDLLFLVNEKGVYDICLENETINMRFDFDSVGIWLGHMCLVYPLSDGRVLVANRGPNSRDHSVPAYYSTIRLKTDAEIAHEEEMIKEWEAILLSGKIGDITVGTIGMHGGINHTVNSFNRAHPYSQITLKEYVNPFSNDISEGLRHLNNDIIRGVCPDVLFLHRDLSYGLYAAKGVFLDLNPFLEADETFDMADYRENIIRAYEIGGRLYAVPIQFFIETMYGKTSELGDMKSWNMDELIAFTDRFPDSMIFRFPFKTDVLDICLKANGENMVDWGSDDIGFDRDLLIKILEFSNRFTDPENYFDDRLVLDRVSVGDIRLMEGFATPMLQHQIEVFREPINRIGYPSETGDGYLINSMMVAAISSNCEYTDTAWQFICYLLSDEVQRGVYFPVKRDSIEPIIDEIKEMSGAYNNASDDQGFYISYVQRPVTDEEIELFLDLLEIANEIRIFDQEVDKIIKEEARAYFIGSKTLTEVADIVENRVRLYIWEQK